MPRAKRNADEALLAALACGATLDNAARTAGISARTAHRRMHEPDFQARLAAFRADLVQRTASMVTAANLEAVKTLIALQDTSTPPGVRLGAARALLEFGIKLRDSAEMEQRIAALEQLVHQGGDHAHRTAADSRASARESSAASDADPAA